MESIGAYLQVVQQVLARMDARSIMWTVALLFDAWREERRVFLCGNGGSASTASHMANDLSKATIVPGRRRMKVIALTDNISLITAWANDSSYEDVFSEQLENLMESGDVLLAISASGNSPNVLRAVARAARMGGVTIGWTGQEGGRLKDMVDLAVMVPTDDIGMIESCHLVLDHLVTMELRRHIAGHGVVGVPLLAVSDLAASLRARRVGKGAR